MDQESKATDSIETEDENVGVLLQIGLVLGICALVSVCLCEVMHLRRALAQRKLKAAQQEVLTVPVEAAPDASIARGNSEGESTTGSISSALSAQELHELLRATRHEMLGASASSSHSSTLTRAMLLTLDPACNRTRQGQGVPPAPFQPGPPSFPPGPPSTISACTSLDGGRTSPEEGTDPSCLAPSCEAQLGLPNAHAGREVPADGASTSRCEEQEMLAMAALQLNSSEAGSVSPEPVPSPDGLRCSPRLRARGLTMATSLAPAAALSAAPGATAGLGAASKHDGDKSLMPPPPPRPPKCQRRRIES